MSEDNVAPFPPASHLPALSEDALALQFSTKHAADLRFVAMWNKWLRWTGTKWEPDKTVHIFDLVRDLCRSVAVRVEGTAAKGVASHHTVAAVAALARSDRRHAALPEQWDTNPWLLSTPSGTVDLLTGDLRPHSRGDHAMFFFYGLGGNGKTVLLSTVTGILGDYHTVAPIEMLLACKHERHPTELAGLLGRRMVTAVETEGGKRWAEAKLKHLTGGEQVAARFMGRDFFTFTPQFKLVVAGNHKPSLNTVDEAMRRRFNLVPFNVTIPIHERDSTLAEKLKAEWPQILQWLIDGCAEWQEHGLAAPKAVSAATDEYLAAQDTVKNWRAECLADDQRAETPSAGLYASWKAWCEANGEFVGSNKSLSQKLMDQGLVGYKRSGVALFRGIKVVA